MFDKMIKIGIEPNEHINSIKFWADVKKRLNEFDQTELLITEEDQKPCECFI